MTDENADNDAIEFDDALFQRFANGELSPQVEARVAHYLESHPELMQKVAAASADGFLRRVRVIAKQSPLEKDRGPAGKKLRQETKPVATNNVPLSLRNYDGYEVIRELGRGGMGVVYLAKNVRMDRLEVLKVLSERLLNQSGAKERFLREIRSVSRLNHPNIVTSYSVLPLDDLTVFAMEYVRGEDLHQFVTKSQPISVPLACSFAKQIAAGLQHAHERGLVHRDIKPSNIIVYKSSGYLLVKILDFGLSKASSEKQGNGLTADGTLLGTPEYMSPEQTLNPSTTDIRADIYSLGCTLYFMLVGKAPFSGTHGAVLLSHSQHEPPSISLVRSDVPPKLLAVVEKMLAKNVKNRFQEPKEVAAALSPFLEKSRKVRINSASAVSEATETIKDEANSQRDTPAADGSVERAQAEVALLQNAEMPDQERFVESVSVSQSSGVHREPLCSNPSDLEQPAAHRQSWVVPAAILTLLSLLVLLGFAVAWRSGNLRAENSRGTAQKDTPNNSLPTSAELENHTNQASIQSAVDADTESTTSNDGYVSLFNGKDLSGWTITGNPNAIWKVVDGKLIGTWQPRKSFSGGSTLVADRRDYKNFRLRIETMPTKNWACSLVLWWDESQSLDRALRKNWTRVQIGAASGDQQMDTGIIRTSVFGTSGIIAEPRRPIRLRPIEWFTEEVEVIDNRIRVFVRDSLCTELTVAERPQGGSIGIALSGEAEMRIRKIEIKELP